MAKKGWGDTKPDTKYDWREEVDLYRYKKCNEEEFQQIRLVGDIVSAAIHWVEIKTREGKKTSFPIVCNGYDSDTEDTDEEICPACVAKIYRQKFYLQNGIIRQLQEDKPVRAKSIEEFPEEAKREFRKKGDKHWTPIKVLKIPTTVASQLRNLYKLNRHKIQNEEVNKDVSDPKYGVDIFIKYDPEEVPAKKYDVQRGELSKLNEEELNYKLYNLNIFKTDPKKAEKDLLRLGLLKKHQIRHNKLEEISEPEEDENITMDNSDELPPALEEDIINDEEKVKKEDIFDKMDRQKLIAYVKKNNLQKGYKFKSSMNEEEIREGIRIAIKKLKSCFGNYDGASKCFKCIIRTDCLKKMEEDNSEDDAPF